MRPSQAATHPPASSQPGTSPTSCTHTGAGVRIGVFDSGLGGLSVLKAIRTHLPDADLLYVADSGHAPYGEREESYIVERAARISDFLMKQGVDALVVACNTATAAAVHSLRQRWQDTPVIGVEPGVKPAVQRSRSGRIGVLATPGTLGSEKFRRLVEQHGAQARLTLQPCPGLAKAIESGDLHSDAVRQMVETYAAPLRQAGVDTVVLGCTHYPFVADQFQAALGPDVALLDTAEAVALQTMRMTSQVRASTPREPGHAKVRLWSSGEPAHLSRVARAWLGWHTEALPMPEPSN
jgi:glutamate racemase